MTVDARDFHLEEYKHFTQEISSLMDRVWTITQFLLGGTAAIYAWILTNGVNVAIGMWMPFFLSLFATLIVSQTIRRIHGIRAYLIILENYFHKPDQQTLSTGPVEILPGQVTGWEQFRERHRSGGGWEKIAVVFLSLVSLGTLVLVIAVERRWLTINSPHEATVHCPG
jgi:hypothetical protein